MKKSFNFEKQKLRTGISSTEGKTFQSTPHYLTADWAHIVLNQSNQSFQKGPSFVIIKHDDKFIKVQSW